MFICIGLILAELVCRCQNHAVSGRIKAFLIEIILMFICIGLILAESGRFRDTLG